MITDRWSSAVDSLPDPHDPIRSELFGVERLEEHARSLAAAQPVADLPARGRRLLPRLADNGRVLLDCYRRLADAIREEQTITPAAEWLVDNFHIVDDQLREIREDLPRAYYRQLPKITDGFLTGYPRVFGIAWAFVAHTDSRIEPEALRRFVAAYQREQPLLIGELWAIAITIRLVLVENLRRLAERIVRDRRARQEADELADAVLGQSSTPDAAPPLEHFETAPLPPAFAVRLVQRLREQDPDKIPALRWLDQRLAAQGTLSDEIVRLEHQRQASMNVTVRNIITSMRLLSTLDWKEFVESLSRVDEILRAGTNFAAVDFRTRDQYRHAIEDLARGCGQREVDVAEEVARRARDGGPDPRAGDPGYHLMGGGRRALETALSFRPSLRRRFKRSYLASPMLSYLGTLAISCAMLLALPLLRSAESGVGPLGLLLFGALALFPTAELAVILTNLGVVGRVRPLPMPRLALSQGVPPEMRTLVCIPSLLTSAPDVEHIVGALEIHFLANPEPELRFALLSDWVDGDAEHMPPDAELLATATAGIARLNQHYGPAADGGPRFFLFHRARRFNPRQGVWMGWERKRGKLHELNRLLRGAHDTTFITSDGTAPLAPSGVRYVITLDADTRLPVQMARSLIGTIAHPLNQPRVDPAVGRVVEGYGVLQPRVVPTLPVGAERSLYHWISAGPCGIDPYAAANSDVYQDLFGEGSYTGKGIYDVDAFEGALTGRVPDDTVLSHDLLEGTFARAGLVADLAVFEEFPSNYLEASARQHRWARGDWQLLRWIVGPAAHEVPWLGRWKMIDNLRRTLTAPFALLTLVVAWCVSPLPGLWTKYVVAMVMLPALVPVLDDLVPRRRGISKRGYVRRLVSGIGTAVVQSTLSLTLLAHQAAVMTDAVVRTLGRVLFTHRHLLEWTTAAQVKAGRSLALDAFYRQMLPSVAVSGGVLLVLSALQPSNLTIAGPLLLLWIVAPLVARRVSQPLVPAVDQQPTPDQARLFRLTARRTWRYFETFVGADDHALPPDNFQEDPKPVVAHRTSPTNIGLYLLSSVTAHDRGWIGLAELTDRLEATFATLAKLERFQGHFYNWYDTQSLRPLEPLYVSSVDSGNLIGHLIAIAQACDEFAAGPGVAARAHLGIEDAIDLVVDAAAAEPDDRRTLFLTRHQIDTAVADVRAALTETTPQIDTLKRLHQLTQTLADIGGTLAAERGDQAIGEVLAWARAAESTVASHLRDHVARAPDDGAPHAFSRRLQELAARARHIVDETRFQFLLDPTRNLLLIGYRVREGDPDPNCYDLLASEARLASFVAIAKGDLPPSHWFQLGRSMTPVEQGAALISWSGSMFEYLMPALVMESPPESVLEQTNRCVVRRQIRYGASRGVPWGISESAFNARDLALTYQYSNFGVPGLGLKRGLSEDLVIAPYATALAAMVEPVASAENFAQLARLGAVGAYGFYEAIDYTTARLRDDDQPALVRAFMAHHQGMSVVALANVLDGGVMRARFHAEPAIMAADLLLQERAPQDVAVARPRAEEVQAAPHVRDLGAPAVRRFTSPYDPVPRTHLLSNGEYAVMMTAAGSGYSRWRDLAITRWREDATRDDWGQYVFVRDVHDGTVWSAGHQPTGVEAEDYEACFLEDHAAIRRRDRSLATLLEVVVSAEDDAEIRRVTITNSGRRAREIELTSYAELVLAPANADLAHPAFSKLFVHTEAVLDRSAILATRRLRSPEDPVVWAAHVVAVEGERVGPLQFETDRARFLGRGRTVRAPASVIDGRPLSNTAGSVLDPIFSLRQRIRVPSGASVRVTFSTVVAPTRDAVLDLSDKFRDPAIFERVVTLARTQALVQLHHLNIEPTEAVLFQRLANCLLYHDPAMRPVSTQGPPTPGGAPVLWGYGISGDIPIMLVRIDDVDDQELVRQLLRAHEYWRLKQLAVDLVIINEQGSSYTQELQGALEALVRSSQARLGHLPHEPQGNVAIIRGDRLPAADRAVLESAARAVFLSRHGTVMEQLARAERAESGELRPPPAPLPMVTISSAGRAPSDLEFWNGLGGFAQDGREYVVALGDGQQTPAPWLNVIANRSFGFQVSESGSGYTWAGNSRENQLTPWSNDPVTDPPGEVFYVRDDDSGTVWTPTALPIREQDTIYLARHGQGYSRFEHVAHGVALELLQLVPWDASVKLSRLSIENRSDRPRRFTLTGYVEWVLGASRAAASPYVITERDPTSGALLARNPWHSELADRVAFFAVNRRVRGFTTDRREFLGRNGSLDRPLGVMGGRPLMARSGRGLDTCGVLQTSIELRPHASTEVVFLLGQAPTVEEARGLIARFGTGDVEDVLDDVRRRWDDILGAVQVRTPDRSLDLLLNRWLLYQTLACRIWARAAFYQAGGAYGFRDQLQDVLALAVPLREVTREHLVRAAARQFTEGDVQHWWHPPSGRGTRTKVADDPIWLAYAASHYLSVTGDAGLLDEAIPFLQGQPIPEGHADIYFTPTPAPETASFFEHCARGLDRSLATGVHGLPLMGAGDWNDGMNRVGQGGKGESVWMGWFLYATLQAFEKIADARGEHARRDTWRTHAAALAEALEREAWDGDWYRRAFFDDGTPLGSAANEECRIDSIAQSWAVLSGAAPHDRAVRAMAAMEEALVRRGDGIVLLFSPPFARSTPDPGYIQGYLPGVRENGGQYTHAAIWAIMAFAGLGDGDKAGELFSIVNPINHASTRAGVHRYKVEPYVVAADVYAESPHVGRGGWTWYTGSAGWMYRAGLEWLLGFRVRGATLYIDPCIPRGWPRFEIVFRYHATSYTIVVENPSGVMRGVRTVTLDGATVSQERIELINDQGFHRIAVAMG